MSRGRDDDRGERQGRGSDRLIDSRKQSPSVDAFSSRLLLPPGDQRDRVECRGREYLLNGPQTRALATVGSFRVVAAEDLGDARGDQGIRPADLRHLTDQGLVIRESLTDAVGTRHVLALTAQGKELLESHQEPDRHGREQAFYAGIVKPRELAHDSQLYRAFREEADRIEAASGRVTRVVLDYELKSEYQKFLNRANRPDDADLRTDRQAFADANDLQVVRDHLELPDLRIEYETPDGRLEHRDVELVTEHYSRGQLAGKARAGFACYRAAGSGRSGSGRRGGTPFDPRHLERL